MLFSSIFFAALAVLSAEAAAITATTACNNSPDLCSRSYNNVTHLGAHDSSFLRDSTTSFSTSGNQFYNATVALSAGVRMLQAQVHNQNGVLQLCHTSCTLLDGGTLQSWLSAIRYWMDNNPNEVVTLLLVNSDGNSTASFGSAFSSSGIDKYGYTPSSTTGPITTWPTLQTLIEANTRLVTFVTSITYSSAYPYLMPEFNYVFETAFDVTLFTEFNCVLDRPSSLSSATAAIADGYLPLINHFKNIVQFLGIEIPDIGNITTTNSPNTTVVGSLGLHVQSCRTQWGIKPTFILVDFFNVGPAISAVDSLNGITATGRTKVSTALLTAAPTTSGVGDKFSPKQSVIVLAVVAGTIFFFF